MISRRKNLGIGVIGLGNWGPNLIRNFIAAPRCDVRYACDLDRVNYRKLDLGEMAPEFTGDYRDILQDSEVDAVVIATPSETHFSIGKEVLEAGKHLFVEKPLALSSKEAAKLVALAAKKERTLMVGHLLMYHPGVSTMVRLVNRGKIGKIFFVSIRRRNLGRVQKDCSVLWDLGPHDISLALMAVDRKPLKVVTTGQSFLQNDFPEVAFTTITFEGGILAHIEESWLAHEREREMVIVGEKGMLVFDELSSSPLKFYKKAIQLKKRTEVKEFDYLDGGTDPVEIISNQPLETECLHFLDCIRNGKEPLSGGENGLQVLRVLEAAHRSLHGGGKVTPVRGD